MNVKCGTDIIEVERIREAIEKHNDKFLNEIFTDKEIEYCDSKKNMRYQHFAARFAAKEAVFKAISELLKDKYDITWKDIEILNDENSRPYVNLNKIDSLKDIESIDISISHIKDYAIATCIVMI